MTDIAMKTEMKNGIADEVDKTLQAFDDDVVLAANPFLASRIKALRSDRLQPRTRIFSLKLGLNQALMVFILLMNLITVVYWFERNSKHDLQERLVAELKNDFQVDQSQNSY
jgi:hypothetical protein